MERVIFNNDIILRFEAKEYLLLAFCIVFERIIFFENISKALVISKIKTTLLIITRFVRYLASFSIDSRQFLSNCRLVSSTLGTNAVKSFLFSYAFRLLNQRKLLKGDLQTYICSSPSQFNFSASEIKRKKNTYHRVLMLYL